MVRHAVAWSMGDAEGGELDGILGELRRLPQEIPEIVALSCGPLLNDSELDAALCVDVADREALERYRSHPAHQPVLERLRGSASSIVVADYEF
jgi:hypothetical protein